MPAHPEAPTNVGSFKETIGKEKNPVPKRKLGKRTPRKLMDDPSIPVLLKGLRLAHPEDPEHVNTLHCFVRSKLLEVYVLKGETIAIPTHASQGFQRPLQVNTYFLGLMRIHKGFDPAFDNTV